MDRPNVGIDSPSDPAIEGGSITIQCSMDAGYPGLGLVTWWFNGAHLDIDSDAAISGGTVSSPSLGISNISPRHHGSYLCTRGNAAGSTNSSSGGLTVCYAPKGEPRLSSNKQVVAVEDSVTFTCETGNLTHRPDLDYYVFYNSTAAVNSSDHVWTSEIFQTITEGGEEYACAAGNLVGTGMRSQTVSIEVQAIATREHLNDTALSPQYDEDFTLTCIGAGNKHRTKEGSNLPDGDFNTEVSKEVPGSISYGQTTAWSSSYSWVRPEPRCDSVA